MDIKKKKQYYLNRDKILEKSMQYFHDKKEERQKYNQDYWSLHGHQCIEKRNSDENIKEKRKQYHNDNKDKIFSLNKNIIMIIEKQYLNIML